MGGIVVEATYKHKVLPSHGRSSVFYRTQDRMTCSTLRCKITKPFSLIVYLTNIFYLTGGMYVSPAGLINDRTYSPFIELISTQGQVGCH